MNAGLDLQLQVFLGAALKELFAYFTDNDQLANEP